MTTHTHTKVHTVRGLASKSFLYIRACMKETKPSNVAETQSRLKTDSHTNKHTAGTEMTRRPVLSLPILVQGQQNTRLRGKHCSTQHKLPGRRVQGQKQTPTFHRHTLEQTLMSLDPSFISFLRCSSRKSITCWWLFNFTSCTHTRFIGPRMFSTIHVH